MKRKVEEMYDRVAAGKRIQEKRETLGLSQEEKDDLVQTQEALVEMVSNSVKRVPYIFVRYRYSFFSYFLSFYLILKEMLSRFLPSCQHHTLWYDVPERFESHQLPLALLRFQS